MDLSTLFDRISEFSRQTHGSSDYDKDEHFVAGKNAGEYAPLKWLSKKIDELKTPTDLLKQGFVISSYDLFGDDSFQTWFEKQFSRKLARQSAKRLDIFQLPGDKRIFDAIETVHKSYEILRSEQIILNSKNFPIQLGEWYARRIFGLKQTKSPSQRGFDFELEEKRVEVKVHWSDQSSPKGVKIRKSLVELSDYCIIIYLARNFMVREICFLNSDYVLRKFAGKGHTIFLKDTDIGQYFFSKSDLHLNKAVNNSALLKYASPTFALKLTERIS